MSTTIPTYYLDYLEKKKQLDKLIEQQLAVLSALSMSAWLQNLSKLREGLQSTNFKILVMGEFNRGKSTFINALLRQKVLPAFSIPTTAIISEVKWGEAPKAILHFLPSGSGSSKKQLEVPVDQIGRYIVIKDSKPGYSNQQMVYVNPYEKVELFWPLSICHDGIEIIDSPGLNEDTQRQEITLEYLKTVDTVIFVIACDFPISRSESTFIETIKNAGHEYIFFICNRINMIDPEERDLVKDRCISLLAPFTKGGQNYVFFINARGALEGQLSNNYEQIKQSNILQLENDLKTFLATERGRIKLLRPATELKASVRAAERILPEREKLLHIDLETIQARYANAQGELNQLEKEREQIFLRLTSFRVETRNLVQEIASSFYNDVADKIEGWIIAYEVKNPLKLREVFSQDARERIVEEVTQYLTEEVRREFKLWQTSTFEPLLATRLTSLAVEFDEKTRQFVDNLEQVRLDLVSDVPVAISSEAANQDKVSIMERVLAAASGFLIGDIGSMAIGATFGFKAMMMSLIPQTAITVATVVLIGWNPIILIPALLLGGSIQALIKTNALNKKIRDTVGKEYRLKLKESQADLVNSIVDSVDERLREIQEALNKSLGLEIQNIRDQVNSVIELKQKGQEQVDAAIAELTTIFNELNLIDREVDVLIEQVALAKSHI